MSQQSYDSSPNTSTGSDIPESESDESSDGPVSGTEGTVDSYSMESDSSADEDCSSVSTQEEDALEALFDEDSDSVGERIQEVLKHEENVKRVGCPKCRIPALYLAVRAGRLDLVQILLERDDVDIQEPVRIPSSFGYHVDCNCEDRPERVRRFIAEKNMQPVHAAARGGHADILRLLLVHASNKYDHIVNTTVNGWTPLHFAAEKGHVDCVQVLLEYSSLGCTGTDAEDFTPIQLASLNGNSDCLELLLNREEECPKQVDAFKNGYDALRYASYHGHIDCVRLLLGYAKSYRGLESPIHLACLAGNRECLDLLLGLDIAWIWLYHVTRRDEFSLPIHLAAFRGHADCIEYLLAKDKQMVDLVDEEQRSTLYWACLSGNTMSAKILLQHGADCNIGAGQGKTPLLVAAWKGHPQCVALLLEYGANIDATGTLPHILAAQNGNAECLDLLLKANIEDKKIRARNVKTKNEKHSWDNLMREMMQESSALLLESAKYGRPTCVELLLKQGVNANVSKDEYADGASPLLLAVCMSQVGRNISPGGGFFIGNSVDAEISETIDLAIMLSQVFDCRNRGKFVRFRDVTEEDYLECIRILMAHGADKDQPDNDGDTPLSLAEKAGRESILQLLHAKPGEATVF